MKQLVRDFKIKPDENEVFRYLGYVPELTEIDNKIKVLIKNTIIESEKLYSALCIINTEKLIRNEQTLSILSAPELDLNSKTVREKLTKNTFYLSLLVATIGEKLEQQVEKLFTEGNYTKSIVLDAIGSAAVENLADQLELKLVQQAEKYGYLITPRFSPGYGDWSLSNQREIIKATDAEQYGIKINSSQMLLPRKSITAIIGWSNGSSIENRCSGYFSKCKECTKKDCKYRKI